MKRGANMNKLLIAYGLTKPQFAHLQAALPEEYELVIAACVTDLIVRNAVCVVINAANMCQDAWTEQSCGLAERRFRICHPLCAVTAF